MSQSLRLCTHYANSRAPSGRLGTHLDLAKVTVASTAEPSSVSPLGQDPYFVPRCILDRHELTERTQEMLCTVWVLHFHRMTGRFSGSHWSLSDGRRDLPNCPLVGNQGFLTQWVGQSEREAQPATVSVEGFSVSLYRNPKLPRSQAVVGRHSPRFPRPKACHETCHWPALLFQPSIDASSWALFQRFSNAVTSKVLISDQQTSLAE